MSDPRFIPLAISLDFPAQALTGSKVYKSFICDFYGATWVSLADPSTGNSIATVTIPNNVSGGSSAIVAAAGVYAKATQDGDDELQPIDSVEILGDGSITPAVPSLIGLASASALLLSDPQAGNFVAGRGLRPDGASVSADSDDATLLSSAAFGYGFDDASAVWIPRAVASAANLGTQDGIGAQLTTGPGEWTITDAPAAAAAASATKAAGADGVCHVITSFCADLCAVAAQATPLTFVIRDGVSGAGAILYQRRLIAPAGTTASIEITGLNIIGTSATAMTVECLDAPDATNFATVSASGYSVSAPPPAPVAGILITIGLDPTSSSSYGYGDASNGNYGSIDGGALPAPYTFAQYRENEFNGAGIRISGDSFVPAADAFTTFSIYDDTQTLVLGPVTFASAGFTGVSSTNTREWSWDDLGSTPLHTIGLGGTFTLVIE